jgi:glutathione synthase/RimK-type ligase-like ATP-grasp enzyme
MKLLILSNTKHKKNFNNSTCTEKIYSKAKDLGVDVYLISPSDFSYKVCGDDIELFYNGVSFNDVDVVLVRRITGQEAETFEVLRIFEKLEKIVIGANLACPFPVKKINQHLYDVNLFPKSFYFSKESKDFSLIKNEIGIPFLIKPANGSNGKGVQLINTEDEFNNYFEYNDYDCLIVQEFLDIDIECRVVVFEGESLGACKKISDNLAKNHTRGSSFEYLRDEELEKIAVNFAFKYGYGGVTGVDIVRTKSGKIYILESNNCPGLVAFEEASSIDVSEKIIQFCLDKHNKL